MPPPTAPSDRHRPLFLDDARPLAPDCRERFERWLADGIERHTTDLTRRELRVGVQALSSLYVERRDRGRLAARSLEGRAKRAAFATYFAALHFLTVHALLDALLARPRSKPDWRDRTDRILDLGCGTGASGAAAATRLGAERKGPTPLTGVDVSGWALGDARRTWRAFGLDARARRASLPSGLGRPGGPVLALAGWSINELDEATRDDTLAWLERHLDAGGATLVVEPLAGAAVPWWPRWRSALGGRGAVDGQLKVVHERPDWIAGLDRDAGLDHARLGARWLVAPAAGS